MLNACSWIRAQTEDKVRVKAHELVLAVSGGRRLGSVTG